VASERVREEDPAQAIPLAELIEGTLPDESWAYRRTGSDDTTWVATFSDLIEAAWGSAPPDRVVLRTSWWDDEELASHLRSAQFKVTAPRSFKLGPISVGSGALVAEAQATDPERLRDLIGVCMASDATLGPRLLDHLEVVFEYGAGISGSSGPAIRFSLPASLDEIEVRESGDGRQEDAVTALATELEKAAGTRGVPIRRLP
jgi:hypothetical protein